MSEQVPVKLTLDIETVAIDLVVGGTATRYIMKELIGTERAAYMEVLTNSTTLSADGKPMKIRNIGSIQAKLVAASLWGPGEKKVEEVEVSKWPARVIDQLFEMAKKLSKLDKGGEDEAKND